MHYKDGTEAKVGDLVKGTTYNTPKGSIQIGVMLGITPGSSACNCRVAIPRIVPCDPMPLGRSPKVNGPDDLGSPFVAALHTSDGYAMVHRESAPSDRLGDTVLVGAKIDYSQCDHLELVHRPGAEA